MNSVLIGLLAETFIHPGSGQNEGAIDLPVAREAATDYPFIAGSSLKGSFRDKAEQAWGVDSEPVNDVFGKQEGAGNALVSDARLLLLPVRSLSGACRWATCPHLLERLRRDLARHGQGTAWESPKPDAKRAIASGNGKLFLEERSFEVDGTPDSTLIEAIQPLIPHESAQARLAEQLVVLSDNDFAWFARYGLAVQARNQLTGGKTSSKWFNPETNKWESGNLWYEETLPPDTLMYALLSERNGSGALAQVNTLFDKRPYLQTGGNETVGQGWFAVQWLDGGAS